VDPKSVVARWVAVALVAAGLLGSGLGAASAFRARRLFEDERHYLRAAAHLTRSRTLSFSPLPSASPAPGAFREPGYPALLALTWAASGSSAPAHEADLDDFFADGRRWRASRALQLELLWLAAAASGLAARRLAGTTAGALAFALVAASPALTTSTAAVMSEPLAAAACAAVGLLCVRALDASPGAALAATGMVGLAPLVRSEAIVLLPVALAFYALARRPRPSRGRVALAVLLVALPATLWSLRNATCCGRFVVADRGGFALSLRARLDADVARWGVLPAMLAWTPLDAARRAASRRAPEATFADQRPSGPGNFLTRAIRDWQAERRRPGADPLALDRELGREGLTAFLRHPGAHAATALAVGWRGLFAERSPGWARPFDLAFALGLALWGATAGLAVRAGRRGDLRALAWVAPALVLFAFHVAATEFLPRYAAPLLPIGWTAVAILVAGPRRRAAGA